MSDNRRDNDKGFSIRKSSTNDHRKRTNAQRTSNIDAKVYVGNVPTDYLTDGELLDFFKTFGKVSDIRVYKGYIFVQYDRVDDARKLIKQAQSSLILKGNKLDILPAMEASSFSTKSSSNDPSDKDQRSFQRESSRNSRYQNDNDRHSENYEPPRKRYSQDQHKSNFNNNYGDGNVMEMDDSSGSSSRCRRRSPNISSSRNNKGCYTTLIGGEYPRQLIDCQIILVNPRQRTYGEEISSRLRSHGLITSIVLLREDYTLVEAAQNAANEECLYAIIIMPMHEERRTASFHILHGQTEEHRNLKLENGYEILLRNYSSYKERIENENDSDERIIYPSEDISSNELIPPPSIGEKFPLSMLLCLLADGRQLTLDEIDRVLIYLLEKKSKMLTLPQGTLPPLPAQYAIQQNNLNEQKKDDLSSTIVEQIREILSSNLLKSSSIDPLNKLIENQDKNCSKEGENVYSNPHITPSFHYPSNENSFYSPLKQFIYPSYQTLPNSSAANAAAAIFQAYEQFNSKSTSIPSINNQQQIRK